MFRFLVSAVAVAGLAFSAMADENGGKMSPLEFTLKVIKGSPVELEGWNACEVFRTDFTGIGQGVDVVVFKPEPHALLHQMMLI